MIYGEFTTKTGLIRVEVLDNGSTEQVEVSDIGSLKYEFDLVPDSPDVTSVQALYEKIEIELFQFGFQRTDLYDRLIANAKAQGGLRVNLYIAGDLFAFFIQVNDIKLSEVDRLITLDCRVLFDENATVLDVFNAMNPNLFRDFFPDGDTPSERLDATPVGEWIGEAMRSVFLNSFPSVVESGRTGLNNNYNKKNYTDFDDLPQERVGFIMAKIEGDHFVTFEAPVYQGVISFKEGGVFEGSDFLNTVKSGDKYRLFDPGGSFIRASGTVSNVISDNEVDLGGSPTSIVGRKYAFFIEKRVSFEDYPALESLQELAAIEGAIFGTGFGRNFYVNRVLDQLIVDIPWDDVTDISPEPFWNPFAGGAVTQLARTFSDAQSQTKNIGVENFGIIPTSGGSWELPLITDARSSLANTERSEYTINLSLPPGYPFLNKARCRADLKYIGKYSDPALWYFDFSPSIALCRSGLRSLRKALSSDGESLFIELTCFEATRVKPWNLFRIVDGDVNPAPDKYKNRVFRSTSIDYDFVRDMATFEAYEILDSDIPEPSFGLNAFGESSSSGSVSLSVQKVISVSGESASSGQMVIDVAGTTYVDAKGASQSSGTVEAFKAATVNAEGTSDSSGEVTTNVILADTPEPRNVMLSLGSPQVEWDAPTLGTPDKYEINYRVNGGFWNALDNNISGSATSYSFDPCSIANNEDNIQIRLRAVFPSQTSSWVESNSVELFGCF